MLIPFRVPVQRQEFPLFIREQCTHCANTYKDHFYPDGYNVVTEFLCTKNPSGRMYRKSMKCVPEVDDDECGFRVKIACDITQCGYNIDYLCSCNGGAL